MSQDNLSYIKNYKIHLARGPTVWEVSKNLECALFTLYFKTLTFWYHQSKVKIRCDVLKKQRTQPYTVLIF